MKQFELSRDYPVSPATIRDLWRDPRFLGALAHEFGGVGEPRVVTTADATLVTMERLLPLDRVPKPFRAMIGSGRLTQVDTWPTGGPDDIRGTWRVTGSAVPSTIAGTHRVTARPAGCRHQVTATVKVSVPLVAGKAESLVARHLRDLVEKQAAFAATWLAEHSTAH